MNKFSILLMTLPLVGVISIGKVQAQITSADDGTGTVVTPVNNANVNQIDITGGETSGTNQFHSLEKFNVNTGQTANFQAANENITNILTRVTGGDVSKINGTIQVTDGNNPNLFLMNPAGFIFGKDATLNLPGSLTVTTANSIEFGSPSFNATGDNNYGNLTGNPNAFDFNVDNIGAIINSGNLSVKEGQNITLVGGTVVSTGTLAAKDGQITIAALAGKNTVRITPQGNLLSLDIQLLAGNSNTLPDLLTGGNIDNVTGITVDNGTVTLTGSSISIKDGDAVLSAQDNIKVNSILGENVSIISQNGNIKTDGIRSAEKVFLSAKKGNIEVDSIFAGEFLRINPSAGDIDIKTGGFFRANEINAGPLGSNSITVVNPVSVDPDDQLNSNSYKTRPLPFVSIKTKNDATPTLRNKPGNGIGEVKIEVGSKFFVVGIEIPDGESGTAGSIGAQVNSNQTIVKHDIGREFGKSDPDPPQRIINPPPSEKPGDSNTDNSNTDNSNTGNSNTGNSNTGNSNTGNSNTGNSNTGNSNTGNSNTADSNTGDSNTGNSNTADSNTGNSNTADSNTADSNTGDSNTSDSNTGNSNTGDSDTGDSDTADSNTGDSDIGNQEQQQDRDQNQEQEEITVFGVLSLDESLVALLKDKGHASELTLSNDGNGELTGSDFNLFNTDDEEELKTFNFDRDLLYKNYVFSRK